MRFEALRETLLIAGIAPRHVRRYLRERDDHLADLTEAQRAAGHGNEDAAVRARALWAAMRIGGGDVLSSPSLRSHFRPARLAGVRAFSAAGDFGRLFCRRLAPCSDRPPSRDGGAQYHC